MSTDSVVDPRDKMRPRDVNKLAKGEQVPRPSNDHHPFVSKASPPTSTDPKPEKAEGENDDGHKKPVAAMDADAPIFTNQLRNCCIRYYEFYRCTLENDGDTAKCGKFAELYQALCPYEWIEKWGEERELGIFPAPI